MKKIIIILFVLMAGGALADTTIDVKVDNEVVYTIIVSDESTVVVEKTPIPVKVVIPINP